MHGDFIKFERVLKIIYHGNELVNDLFFITNDEKPQINYD